jgi:hypothetical protein
VSPPLHHCYARGAPTSRCIGSTDPHGHPPLRSPIFLRGDAFFVPALFVSFDGKALDEKTPLHRSVQAMSRAGKRLFAAMGLETAGLVNNIGLEQEMFLIPREAYFKRLDLQVGGLRPVLHSVPVCGPLAQATSLPTASTTPGFSPLWSRAKQQQQGWFLKAYAVWASPSSRGL